MKHHKPTISPEYSHWNTWNNLLISKMFIKFFVLLATLLVAFARKNELVLQNEEKVGSVVKTRVNYKPRASLPASLDYRSMGLLTTDLNQHIPVYWLVIYFIFLVLYFLIFYFICTRLLF
jgi:hypothetical protein